MYIDQELIFSEAQALSGAGATASTNHIDLGPGGNGATDMAFHIVATTALSGTTPTLVVALQTDDNASFTSPTTVIQSGTISSLAVGDTVNLGSLPPNLERYVRLLYTLGGTTPATALSAYLVQ